MPASEQRPPKGYRVVLDNLRLVYYLVARGERRSPRLRKIDPDDVRQEAVLTCLSRAGEYDEKRSRPGTYLQYGVMSALSRLAPGDTRYKGRTHKKRLRQPVQEFISLEELARTHGHQEGRPYETPAAEAPCPVEAADEAAHARAAVLPALAALAAHSWKQAWAVRLVCLHGVMLRDAGLMMALRGERVRQLARDGRAWMRRWLEERGGGA